MGLDTPDYPFSGALGYYSALAPPPVPADQESTVDRPPEPPPVPVPVSSVSSVSAYPYRATTLPPGSAPPRLASAPPSQFSRQQHYYYPLPASFPARLPEPSFSAPTPPPPPPLRPRPQTYSIPFSSLPQQNDSSPQPPIAAPSSYYPSQRYSSYQPTSSDEAQPLPYPESYQPQLYDSSSSAPAQGAYPYQFAIAPRVEDPKESNTHSADQFQNVVSNEDPRPPTTSHAVPSQDLASQAAKPSQSTSLGSTVAKVYVQDGGTPQLFASANDLATYLKVFPEADNDQGCRVFRYGPNCPTNLLMPLFEHFDFPRFSMFPYGFASDFSIADQWGAGSCKCQRCIDGRLCGHYVLQKNFHFYAYQDVTPSSSTSPKITSTQDATIISTGIR